jgi:hypothetical protein
MELPFRDFDHSASIGLANPWQDQESEAQLVKNAEWQSSGRRSRS